MASSDTGDRELGAQAARRLYDHWDPNAVFEGELTQGFAEAFIDEYSSIQAARAGSIDRVSSKRAGNAAVQLASEAFRGILEVLQNAEDEKATYLTVAIRRNGARRELLFVHDGEAVRARTVVAMTSAYLSLKESSARKIGKFGIGLKTLQRLGPELEVHCGHYHWLVSDGDAKRIEPAPAVSGLYDPSSSQTMMVLRVSAAESLDGLCEWFETTDARTLLFLQHVRTFEFRQLGRHQRVVSHSLSELQSIRYELQVGKRDVVCDECVLESPDGASWRRYSVELPVGEHARRGKVVDDTIPLAVAVPREPREGLLFSGLPTDQSIGLPFDIGGPFESDVSRERLDSGSAWNSWLLDETRKLAQALAARELNVNPQRAWALVGLSSEAKSVSASSSWLSERLLEFVDREQRALAAATIHVHGEPVRLRELVFESPDLTSVLTAADVEATRRGSTCLPTTARDAERWRRVLGEMLEGAEVNAAEAIGLFDSALADGKKPAWFLGLAACAVEAGLGDALFNAQSVMLADDTRVAPCRDGEGCLLVSGGLAGTDLVSRLSLARQIHPVYTARTGRASAVRTFLSDRGAFSDEHSPEAILRALAGRDEDPVALTEDDLAELADLVAEAPSDFVDSIAAELGMAVTVEGYEWIAGERSYIQVRPAEAYQPAAMDVKDGWANAAGTTPGIRWAHPRYMKSKKLIDAAIGPRKLFRRLGCETAPRLRRPDTVRRDYVSENAYGLGWVNLPELWARGREALEERHGHRPEALLDDWTSPELLAAAEDIAKQRVGRDRRDRAAALIRTLERAWSRVYEDKSESPAVYAYRGWRRVGTLPTTWVARLADIEWLSDCARPSHAVAPVNTRIRSDANATVYGTDGSAYAYELGPADAESPVVKALGIGGLPRASEHIEALRALVGSGLQVGWNDVAHHYVALSSMCPARPVARSEVDDITVSRLQHEFRTGRLLWCGRWLSPSDAFRGGEELFADAAFVPEEAAYLRLWDALGIKSPSAKDCIEHLRSWAAAGRSPEVLGEPLRRTYRALAQLAVETSSKVRNDIKKLPVWIGSGWTAERPVYYSDSEVLSATLSSAGVTVWQVPCALHTLGDLPENLGLLHVAPTDFEVSGRGGTSSVFDVSATRCFESARELMREFISEAMPELYGEIPDEAWSELESAELELVPALTLVGTIGGTRLRVDAHVHLDRAGMQFFFESPAQIGRREVGGALVADAFDLGSADKLKVSLAWVDAWQRASEGEEQMGFPSLRRTPDYIDGAAVPPAPTAPPVAVAPKKKKSPKPATEGVSKRHLVDVDAVVPEKTRTAAASAPEGRIIATPIDVKLDKPSAGNGARGEKTGEGHKQAPAYTTWERETTGLRLLRKILAPIEVRDTRTERVGADGIGTDGRYYELKVHGGPASGPLEMRGSEVLRAREMGGEYILVVVENVEAQSAHPRITFIPNPMSVLDVHPIGKIEVTGYDNEAFEQWELPAGSE